MARTKTVFGTHSNTAHVWAQRNFTHGRSGDGRMFFEGGAIYSHGRHFKIARFTDLTSEGKPVVFFTSRDYSVSTAKHKRHTSNALSGLPYVVLYVDNVAANCTFDYEAEAAKMAADLATTAQEMANPNKNKRWLDEDERIARIQRCYNRILSYCAITGINSPVPHVVAECDAVRAAFAKFYDPKAVAKREAARAKREAANERLNAEALTQYHAFIEGVLPRISNAHYKRLSWNMQREYSSVVHARNPRPQGEALSLEEWRNGKGAANQWGFGETCVRRRGHILETSRGACAPWRAAVAVFIKAQECRATGTAWHTNGERIQVGDFMLTSISASGDIRVGCHEIHYEEMAELAWREVPELVKPCFPVPALYHEGRPA
jgi:hypothetical protein